MDTAIAIWNLLWEYQIEIAVFFVFLIWLVVRGGDLMRWVARKVGAIGKKPRVERESQKAAEGPEK